MPVNDTQIRHTQVSKKGAPTPPAGYQTPNADISFFESRETRNKLYHMYRDYFDLAEKKRRWSLRNDIPWDQCNPNLDPAIADIVQTFCMVELYLPDYLSKLIPQVRANHGRAWMLANWGYEESKHSMAFADWLMRSGARSEEDMVDIEDGVFAQEWELPYDNARAMVIYTMVQELSTQLHYRNLRHVLNGKDPALDKALLLVSTDEAAHADFFRKMVELYLQEDRAATLEQMRRVFNSFKMPAVHLLMDGRRRAEAIKSTRIFDEDIFVAEVYEPLLGRLGLTKADLRRKKMHRTT
jgi:acyl-[acyl-carrier protein] desaturase